MKDTFSQAGRGANSLTVTRPLSSFYSLTVIVLHPCQKAQSSMMLHLASSNQRRSTRRVTASPTSRLSPSFDSTRKRTSSTSDTLKALDKAIKRQKIAKAFEMCQEARQNSNNNRLPYGFVTQLSISLGLSPSDINNESKRLRLLRTSTDNAAIPISVDNEDDNRSEIEESALADKESGGTASILSSEPTLDSINRAKGGRPNGCTLASQSDKRDRVNKATAWVAAKLYQQKQENGKNKHGAMKRAIKEARVIFELDGSDEIKERTIRDRIMKGVTDPAKPGSGATSPMSQLEPLIVNICITMQRIGRAIEERDFLPLVNSLIKGKQAEKDVIQWKQKYCGYSKSAQTANLGTKYFQNFMKRNKDKLVAKHPRSLCTDREKWGTYDNIEELYRRVYDALLEAKVAIEVPPHWKDKDGKTVSDEKEAYGSKVTMELVHPDYFIAVDEVGNNTNRKHDAATTNAKAIVERGTNAKIPSVSTDNRWTALGFTAASGKPVMCVVIFQGESTDLPFLTAVGFDAFADKISTEVQLPSFEEFMRANTGAGKLMPGGPTCMFRDKEVPCYITATPHGGITGEILTDCLRVMDDLDLFPRVAGGPTPVLLIDGHQSRFDLDFLAYIHDKDHLWVVCLGLPHATHYWQVGDSSEQNGAYKINCRERINQLIRYKQEHGMPLRIGRDEVLPIVVYAWDRSFAIEANNRKAFIERGWLWLNRVLLHDPMILATRSAPRTKTATNSPLSSSSSLSRADDCISSFVEHSLNLVDGISGRTFQHVLQCANSRQNQASIKEKLKQGERRASTAQFLKKNTSTKVWAQGGCVLDASILEQELERRRVLDTAIENSKTKKFNQRNKLIDDAQQIKKLSPDKWTVTQAKIMVSYKSAVVNDSTTGRQNKLSPLKSKKADLIDQYKKRENNPSPKKQSLTGSTDDTLRECSNNEIGCNIVDLLMDNESFIANLSLLATALTGASPELQGCTFFVLGSYVAKIIADAGADEAFAERLVANDCDCYYNKPRLSMLGSQEFTVVYKDIRKFDVNVGDKTVEVNTTPIVNLNINNLLRNNDINATGIVLSITPDNSGSFKFSILGSPEFWDFFVDETHALKPIRSSERMTKTLVRISYKSMQMGFPFEDGGIDPASESICDSHKQKVDRMANWSSTPFSGYNMEPNPHGRGGWVFVLSEEACVCSV
jgi:hypothetical protein